MSSQPPPRVPGNPEMGSRDQAMRDSWAFAPGRVLDLRAPRILAIINVTPDSFSDGGASLDPAVAATRAMEAIGDGADALDIGGESTRPGAARVPAPEQIARVVPAIQAIRRAVTATLPITIDTTLAAVAWAALDAGADAINDVSAGTEDPEMLPLIARARCGIILMHRLQPPGLDRFSDQYAEPPCYGDVVAEVCAYLRMRVEACVAAGIPAERTLLDPGLGFGKTVEQNLALIRGTPRLLEKGRPVLSGLSRKSFVARAADMGPDSPTAARLPGTVGLTAAHLAAGARLLRVHDVAPIARLVRAWRASEDEGKWSGRDSNS